MDMRNRYTILNVVTGKRTKSVLGLKNARHIRDRLNKGKEPVSLTHGTAGATFCINKA